MYAARLASVYINLWVFIYSSTAEGALKSEDEKIERTVYTFVSMGVGLIVGPILMGIIQDKCGHKASLTLLLSEVIIFESILLI